MPKPSATGNARITGMFGAAIFVLLFVEGITILRVENLVSAHVFVGVLLIPFVVVKIASTTYRIARYYTGADAYVRKGPPNIILRWLGPVVIITTIAVFSSGIGTVLNPRSHWLAGAHKASFIVWFVAMTAHVIGHVVETPALALADLTRATRTEAPGAGARLAIMLVAIVAGVALAVVARGWAHHWQHAH
jgi:hypothetical protein